MTTTTQTNVAIRYNTIQSEIGFQIKEIQAKLKKHKEKQRSNSQNWGYVGDVAHVKQLLDELNSFLS